MSGRAHPAIASVEVVAEADAGLRLDQFCARRHPEASRSRLADAIRGGGVLLDGRPARPSERVAAGQEVRVDLPALVETRLVPEERPLALLHEDDALLVLDKPADLVVHPGAGVETGTLAAALLHHAPEVAGVGGEGRAGLVHRLDRGTTGVLVVARTPAAHRTLQAQFKERTVEKLYHAIVWGRPRLASGAIDLAVARDPRNRLKMTTRAPGGREAHSVYATRGEVPGFAWLEVRILTGRTHQVRVHLAALGHPVVGDTLYGGARTASVTDPVRRKALREVGRPLLHAFRLAFDHPVTGARLAFEAPWHPDMRAAWAALGGSAPPEGHAVKDAP